MKRFFMFLLATVLTVALFTACEGPTGKDGATGPAGAKGDAGLAGKDGEGVANCKSCHGTDKMLLAMAQYDLSIHNKGIIYEDEAGRAGCTSCHTGDGFRELVETGVDAKTKGTSKINCYTCHPIHTTWSDQDFSLVVNAKQTMRFPVGTEHDFKGAGNLCAKCHQARPYTRTTGTHDSISPANSSSTYSRFGPHYGTSANVFAAKGLVEIEGSEAYPTTSNPHQNLAKGCVSCHMNKDATNPAVGGHSFLMTPANLANVAECSGCHADKTEISGIVQGKVIATMVAEMRTILIGNNWLDTTQAVTDHGYVVLGEYFKCPDKKKIGLPKEDVDAILNYLYIAKDRSLGAHNPKYVYAITKNTLEYLKK